MRMPRGLYVHGAGYIYTDDADPNTELSQEDHDWHPAGQRLFAVSAFTRRYKGSKIQQMAWQPNPLPLEAASFECMKDCIVPAASRLIR